MALNSLNLGTDGALKRGATKAVLVLGVSGMLYFGGNPPIPPSTGGGSRVTTVYGGGGTLMPLPRPVKISVEQDDAEVLSLLKYFIECL